MLSLSTAVTTAERSAFDSLVRHYEKERNEMHVQLQSTITQQLQQQIIQQMDAYTQQMDSLLTNFISKVKNILPKPSVYHYRATGPRIADLMARKPQLTGSAAGTRRARIAKVKEEFPKEVPVIVESTNAKNTQEDSTTEVESSTEEGPFVENSLIKASKPPAVVPKPVAVKRPLPRRSPRHHASTLASTAIAKEVPKRATTTTLKRVIKPKKAAKKSKNPLLLCYWPDCTGYRSTSKWNMERHIEKHFRDKEQGGKKRPDRHFWAYYQTAE